MHRNTVASKTYDQQVGSVAALALAFAAFYRDGVHQSFFLQDLRNQFFQAGSSADSFAVLEAADLHLFGRHKD